MKKFLFCIFFAILCLTGCGKSTDLQLDMTDEYTLENVKNQNDEDTKLLNTPITIMDLFEGDEKVWLYITGNVATNETKIRYDAKVSAIFTTQNSKLTNLFYSLKGSKGSAAGLSINENPNPINCKELLLSDFAMLSDSEIIQKVKQTYGSATQKITGTYTYGDKLISIDEPVHTLPSKITYEGDLDHSGNLLSNEKISFIKDSLEFDVTEEKEDTSITYFGTNSFIYLDSFYFRSVIKPITIKDKEYIGICDQYGNAIITVNTYNEFKELKLDPVEYAIMID